MAHLSLTELEQMFHAIADMPKREQVRVLEAQYAIEWEAVRAMRPRDKEQLVPASVSLALIRKASLWRRITGPSYLARLQAAFTRVWSTVDGMEEIRGRAPDPLRLDGSGVVLPIAVSQELEAFDAKWRNTA